MKVQRILLLMVLCLCFSLAYAQKEMTQARNLPQQQEVFEQYQAKKITLKKVKRNLPKEVSQFTSFNPFNPMIFRWIQWWMINRHKR